MHGMQYNNSATNTTSVKLIMFHFVKTVLLKYCFKCIVMIYTIVCSVIPLKLIILKCKFVPPSQRKRHYWHCKKAQQTNQMAKPHLCSHETCFNENKTRECFVLCVWGLNLSKQKEKGHIKHVGIKHIVTYSTIGDLKNT